MIKKNAFPLILCKVSVFFSLLLFLSSCNLPRPTDVSDDGSIATQVSRLLTGTPPPALPTSVFPFAQSTPTPAQPTLTPGLLATITKTPLLPQTNPLTLTTTPPVQFDPNETLGPPTATDSMDKSVMFLANGDQSHYQAEFQNGSLVMTSFDPNGWHSWILSYVRLNNFFIDAVFQTDECSGLDRYGIMVRSPDPTQGYLFGISCDGRYSFRKWDGSSFTNIIDWTANTSINTGSNQTNRLGIQASESRFALYVNGNLLDETNDETYGEGVFGIFQAASDTENFSVRVDTLSYWIVE